MIIIVVLVFILFVHSTSLAEINHSVYKSVYECLSCHPKVFPSHKLGYPKNVPPGWPVDPSGRMVCITCHDCISGKCVLRETPERVCQACHDCTQGMACMIGVAHLGSSARIEAFASFCLACHDGTIGKSVGIGGHKVDILYIAKKDFNVLRDNRVILIKGRITCISCHNPYSSEKARLVMSNKDSRLCLTCHRK